MRRDFNGQPLVPGYNVDKVDIAAGLVELAKFWPDAPAETRMVIDYALARWARGEEEAAQRMAIDQKFFGIDYGSWLRVLAAARAAASHSSRSNS